MNFSILEAASLFEIPIGQARFARKRCLETCLQGVGREIMYQLGARGGARNDVETELYNRRVASLIREKMKLERELRGLFRTKAHGPKTGVTKEAIERAREYPVEQLLETSGKKIVRCPFHDDTHPSASIKWNRLHCFVCDKSWGPIDLLMEKEGLSFVEAVGRLTN